jgi:hypothetical protein
VPSNAKSFSYQQNFFTYEFPNWICSEFNDFFVTHCSREQDRTALHMFGREHAEDVQSGLARHAKVEHEDVRIAFANRVEGGSAVGAAAEDVEVALPLEELL